MTASKIRVGDDVYVREPQRFDAGCTCIVGPVEEIEDGLCTIRAFVGRGDLAGEERAVTVPIEDVGLRVGTPISQLSGRPGHRGFDEFTRIAASWGYD